MSLFEFFGGRGVVLNSLKNSLKICLERVLEIHLFSPLAVLLSELTLCPEPHLRMFPDQLQQYPLEVQWGPLPACWNRKRSLPALT